jgi:hypothetical protein
MKAKKIYYQKCFNLGNYSNEVIGIELEVEDGEKAEEVITEAKKFVEIQSQEFQLKLAAKENIVANPDNSYSSVLMAQQYIDKYKDVDLPF